MAKNHLADLAVCAPMRYCRRHQRGWYPKSAETGEWYPVSWWKVQMAWSLAEVSGCLAHVQLALQACDVCQLGKEPTP